jgi:hypothetical protein
MSKSLAAVTLALSVAVPVWAVGPTVTFTLPAQDATPSTFGSLPFPNDLYFDQGRPGDGDGTLLNSGASIGLAAQVIETNTPSVEQAMDLMDGFGTTSAIFFFFDGPIDPATLPPSPRLTPSFSDSVFCADATTGALVPIGVKADADSRIANVLSVLPLPGKPLAPKTTYTCVVTTAVANGSAEAAQASADWLTVRDGTSANSDADAICDPVVTMLGTHGVASASIAGMTVFTTESTTSDVLKIRETVLPSLPVPTADFTSQPNLVFDTDPKLLNLLGPNNPHDHVAAIATGFYGAPRFQTHDPDGDGPFGDLPNPNDGFKTCVSPCEPTDERFTRDGSGTPIVIDTADIPFTVVIPKGTPPTGGWPVIIQQHGLGGQRDTVVGFGEADAERGFASIGIDAVAHGYRYFDCLPGAACSQDHANNFGGTAVPDGFVDGTYFGFTVSFLTVDLGFFQAFHNFLGIRDNFRQTYVDLMSLVRLLHGHSIDTALSTTLDDDNIFYMGHSLGGLMGSGFTPIEPDLKGILLNASGGGLNTQLFLNSSIGQGAQSLVNGILGLDPANVPDQFSLAANLTQSILDPADGLNSAHLLLAPADGTPRNVIQVEDYGDEVVPNPSDEALAVATGFQLFDPFVQNLHQNPYTLPVAATAGTIHGNAAGGATAALLQNGPATHAASIGTGPGSLTFVPDFAHPEEYALNGGFASLERRIRVPNAGILSSVLDWFADIATHGPPGTFSFGGQPDFNPAQNATVPAGSSTTTFFARTVNAGGATPLPDTTSDVTVSFTSNIVSSRVTVGRSILGTTTQVTDADLPPGNISGLGTLGFLPFFVTVQRAIPGLFSADLTIAYTTTDLGIAGIAPESAEEQALVVAHFNTGTCTMGGAVCSQDSDCGANGPCLGAGYTALPSTVDTGTHTVTATGITSFSTFAVVHPDALAAGFRPELIPGGGSVATDCRAEWEVLDTTNVPFLDRKGRPSRLQVCRDGDPACDADRTADGTCTFKVAVCLDQTDPGLPTCSASGSTGYIVMKPTPVSADATDAANGQTLVNALAALGGTATGPKANDVRFTVPLSGPTCTALVSLDVPLKRGAKVTKTLKGCAELGKCEDRDNLRLRCLPAS